MKTLDPFFYLFFFYRIFRKLHVHSRRSLHDGERSAHVARTPVQRHSSEDGVYSLRHLHLPWMRTERELGECTWRRSGGAASRRKYPPRRALPSSWAHSPTELSCVRPQMSSDAPRAFSSATWAGGTLLFQSICFSLPHHSISDPYHWTTLFPEWTKPILGK